MAVHDVIIVGGGPTGMMLGAELALAGVDAAIIERRVDQTVEGSRAGGLHARTIEIFDQRGVAERFLDAGTVMQVAGFGGVTLDISDFPTRHPYGLALWQKEIETIMADWVAELGVRQYRGVEMAEFSQNEAGVTVTLSDGRALTGQYLVGCDGGRSAVRKGAGIDFVGWEASVSSLIAEVEMAQAPQLGLNHSDAGVYGIGPLGESGLFRVVLTEAFAGQRADPDLSDVRAGLRGFFGTDFGVHSPRWISRFTDATRQAETYRKGRVLLAGDAAHIHSPAGGQGLNLGVHDAVNLGWKLARVIKQECSHDLLESYHDERHAVGAKVLTTTMAQVALQRGDARTKALTQTLAGVMGLDAVRRTLGAMMAGLDVCYGDGTGHPLFGRRMPDLDLMTDEGSVRVFSLLADAGAVLIDLGTPGGLDTTGWHGRVRHVLARHEGRWTLPVIGDVAAPKAVLVRPDGHVAWVGMGDDAGLEAALTRWLGAAR